MSVPYKSRRFPQSEYSVNSEHDLNQKQPAIYTACLYCAIAIAMILIDGGAGNCACKNSDPSANSEEDSSTSHFAPESPGQESGYDGRNDSVNDNGHYGDDNST